MEPMTTTMPRAYVAGPLFDEGERWWIEQVDQLVADAGFITFLPHRDNPPKDEFNVRAIFENDKRGIDEADVVVANLNGVLTDDGTAWELGYAYAKGKYIIGLHTDWRMRFPHEVVNLMMECSMDRLVRNLDDLRTALAEWLATR
jgi:nucleoside 2-deoxyribosyltransferase